MTFLGARAQYRRADSGEMAVTDDPHGIILVTLRELERSLRALAAANPGPFPASHVNRAFTAIYILQSSLDFDQGGEIAVNLFRVYEYCRLRVAEAFRREPSPRLVDAADHIAGLLTAWQQIGGKA
ncbi:MAG: flagellar biosynthesis protein FliS [Rhodobacteraceae bacterium PARR1]|nr:MAG: flagellar biosynthesis protein FliS [Rhodobacteraceae bacterium PARR1]